MLYTLRSEIMVGRQNVYAGRVRLVWCVFAQFVMIARYAESKSSACMTRPRFAWTQYPGGDS